MNGQWLSKMIPYDELAKDKHLVARLRLYFKDNLKLHVRAPKFLLKPVKSLLWIGHHVAAWTADVLSQLNGATMLQSKVSEQ